VRWFVETVPLFLPGIVLTVIVATLGARPLARRAGIHPAVAFLLVASIGLIVSATLTPLRDALDQGVPSSGTCDMSRTGWPPLSTYLSPTGAALNVILFVPLGVALGLLPPHARWTRIAIVLGLVSPIAVELTQLVVRSLARGCQAADIVDNVTGVALGLLVGMLIRVIARRGTDGTGPA
jgi:hypothetical protein